MSVGKLYKHDEKIDKEIANIYKRLATTNSTIPTQSVVKSYVDAGLSGKADTVHTHIEADITDLDKYTQSEVDSLLSGKSDTGHTHDDRYYTETELDGGQLNNLYYTETEVDTLLSGKANTSHTHVEADITDLGSYIEDITEESLSDLQDVTITSIASGEILKWNGTAWINNTLAEAGISATGHTHDDRYYTETETDTLLSGKANTSHTHVEADITDLGNYSVVGHTHVEADITDLGSYLTDITGESIDDLADVDPANKADGRILQYNQSSGNLEYVEPTAGIVQSGSVSEPSLSFIDDLDTGLFRAADNTLGFTTAGTERLRISTGRFGFRTTTLSTTVNISPEGGAQGVNLMVDSNNSANSGRFFFSNDTAGQSNAIYNAAGVLTFTTGGTPGSSSGTPRMSLSSTLLNLVVGLKVAGDIIQDDLVRPFFSLAHPTQDVEDITITINKFDNTASANDRMMMHWWVSTTQFGSPNHTGTTGVSYTSGAGESSITSYNHAITNGSRQIKIRLSRETGQPSITLYLMCEVQGIVFASDSFTIQGV